MGNGHDAIEAQTNHTFLARARVESGIFLSQPCCSIVRQDRREVGEFVFRLHDLAEEGIRRGCLKLLHSS